MEFTVYSLPEASVVFMNVLEADLLGRQEGRLDSSSWDWREEVGSDSPAIVPVVTPSMCYPTPCLNILICKVETPSYLPPKVAGDSNK